MAASVPGQMRIKSTDQETMDELRSMFPELSHDAIVDLMTRYQGDLTQIVDKLLQNPSPESPVASSLGLSPSVGNSSLPAATAFTTPSIPTSSTRLTPLQPSEASVDPDHSPWGPKASLTGQASFPSAFSGPITASTAAKPVSYASTGPVYTATHEVAVSSPTSSNKSVEGPRSVSPPKTPIRAPHNPSFALEPSTAPQTAPQTVAAAPSALPEHVRTNPAAMQLLASFEATPIATPPTHPVMSLISPIHSNKSNPPEPTTAAPAPAKPSSANPVESHSSSYSPGSIFSSPQAALPLESHPVASFQIRSPLSTNTGSRWDASPLSGSLASSRLGPDERSARLRAAEAQFQSLMASMSELESANQVESELKDSKIATLEHDLKALASEKSTWVSRLQQVSQTSLSLRDQLAEQTKEIEELRARLKKQEDENTVLRAKVASYRPIEAAEQLRSDFETAVSRALAQGEDDSTRDSTELFARTFQQAFAAALLASKPSPPGTK